MWGGVSKGRRRFLSRVCPCRVWGTPILYNPDEAEQGKPLPCVRGSNPVQIRAGRPVSSLPRVRGPNGGDSVSAMKRGPFCTGEGDSRLSFNLLEGHAIQASCTLERFHVEKALPAAGSGRSLRRHKHSASVLSNAGAGVLKLQHCKMVRPCQSMWLFHLHSTAKIRPFSPVFPLAESMSKAFGWLFLWNSKEKKHQPFSMAQPILKFICSRSCRQLDTIY